MDNQEKIWPFERKCGECKKKIEILYIDDWAYVIRSGMNRKYFCSWRCLQKYRKEKNTKTRQGKLNAERQKKIKQMLEDGHDRSEIMDRLDCSRQAVNYYERLKRKGK